MDRKYWLSARCALAIGGCALGALMLGGCVMGTDAMAPVAPASAPSSAPADSSLAESPEALANRIADAYIRLTLEAGSHEGDYVDAYYGPAEWRTAANAHPRSTAELALAARALVAEIDAALATRAFAGPPSTGSQRARLIALRGMLHAADTRLQMLGGRQYRFADEATGLFATNPTLEPLSHYDRVLAGLDHLVPGEGPLAARIDAFYDRYTIPPDRVRRVLEAAIGECRRRTMAHMRLPEGESFALELVTNKPWSGYNYYQGNFHSLIQVNTDLPIRISRAVDLGCHEGYPGHHVLNMMIEQNLVRSRNWQEFTVNPLYSPQSVIAEGSANYGIDLAFPGEEKLAFERDVLYPLAGLDPASAEDFARVSAATDALGGARLTIAKMYLDGEISRERAIELSQHYLLLSRARAEQSMGFTDHYRSYVLNYGWGRDLVHRAVEAGEADAATRWARMQRILSEPTFPADLVAMEARAARR